MTSLLLLPFEEWFQDSYVMALKVLNNEPAPEYFLIFIDKNSRWNIDFVVFTIESVSCSFRANIQHRIPKTETDRSKANIQ